MTCWLVLLLLAVLAWGVWTRQYGQHYQDRTTVTATVQRLLKPHTPDDCPICRQPAAALSGTIPTHRPVPPWRQRNSRRRAPKRIVTQGFACPNRMCIYYRVTDTQIHALVGDGAQGRHERIQTLRCQACGVTCSARRQTPLYCLKTPSQRVGEVLTALAEGLSVAAAVRVFGHRHATITTSVTRAAEHSAMLHTRWLPNLHLPHIQLHELRTRLRSRLPILWLWVAVDPISKLIPVLQLGSRTQDSAYRLLHELREQLAPGCIPVFTSDGLKQYGCALTAHFGQSAADVGRRARQWRVAASLIYGQVKQTYRRRKLVRVVQVMCCGTRAALRTALQGLGLSGRLNTAFVERLNLTIRQSVAALMRRTWATMQDAPQLLLHVEWWRAYSHFVRAHESLREALKQPRERGGKRLPER